MTRMETPLETERPSPRYSGIDLWSPAEILDSMIEGQFAAVAAVHAARPALEQAALAIEERLRAGGRLVYAGAGTSGRLAVQDGAELMPTFSWPAERLLLLMAGGDDALLRAVEGAEDTADEAAALIYQHRIGDKDALISSVQIYKSTKPADRDLTAISEDTDLSVQLASNTARDELGRAGER